MTRKGIWVRSAFDLVFLVLGSVLIVTEGFERMPGSNRIELPPAPGLDGKLADDARAFVLGLTPEGVVLVGEVEHALVSAGELAAAARARGDNEAVVLADARARIHDLYRLIATLRTAGFRAVRLAVEEETPR